VRRDCKVAVFGGLQRLLMHGQQQQLQKLPRSEIALQTSSTPSKHPFRVCTFNVLVRTQQACWML
jgi:hypothetical protein